MSLQQTDQKVVQIQLSTLQQVEMLIDVGTSLLTLYGFAQALFFLYTLSITSPEIVLSHSGIFIQGVPWTWVFQTIVFLAARGVWGTIKGLIRIAHQMQPSRTKSINA